jgi:SAM-dependent methyltransferase
MVHEYPENFARFYDIIYHQMRDSDDSEFYLNEIRQTKGKVLEIGTGTGRFFLRALKEGADIYGLDISPSMINILLKNLDKKEHHRISLQSIVDFSLDTEFELIIAPFRVFMHLLEKADQIKVPDLKPLINGIENQTDFDGEYAPGKRVKRTVSTKPDLHNQLINIDFFLEWDEGNKISREHWLTPLRYFFRFELEHLVERSDFSDYKILGDYSGNELGKESVEFIIVCRK